MKARYMLERPETIDATLKITMTVKEWEELRDQLNYAHPSWRLSSIITNLLADARRTIYPPEKEEP